MKNELKISFKSGKAKGEVDVVTFKDEEHLVRYIPSLQFSAYGTTLEEVEDMTKIVLADFFHNLMGMGESEAMDELRRLGWSKPRYFRKKLVQLSETNIDDLMKEYGIPQNTPVNKEKYSVAV